MEKMLPGWAEGRGRKGRENRKKKEEIMLPGWRVEGEGRERIEGRGKKKGIN